MNGNDASARAYFLYSIHPPSAEAPAHPETTPDPPSLALVKDLWASDLDTLPSLFDRLVFLANLRDENGAYRHYGLELAAGAAAEAVMRESHDAVFVEWLALPLEQQHADLSLFLSGAPGYRRLARASWSVLDRHVGLFPDSAAGHERALYLADLEVVFAVLECQEHRSGQPRFLFPRSAKPEGSSG
jgi:hypothetical protein